ncbi:ABC transporter ATP-binding protein [Gilvimarinus sp. SDUM040013]|uniref:ABC transporter ATP-binding protein n=1 Tax=Gilvimarinus gilvus TaxID=3058038 RepID=A0ABU4RX07_9GAMM|nr:ABC transporter ATP-binding protein [Gilvimarinus sp. SDUM040013]MDO3385757.1 ABC transporter ATP-binding protein [Gilvimarinus sp. SDUM040013]MDX6849397.1 ABC transporter ATP-binding protein [Gilvimarinus sp. SDUM040013]
MFSFFERLLKPFPNEGVEQPPATLLAFCLYYAKGAKRYLLLMALISATIAIVEVTLFGALGSLVDWLNATTPDRLWLDHGTKLMAIGLMLLVGLPVIIAVHSMLIHQTMLGNFPMAIRWKAHRYLLQQSVGFFQDEFSGRLATRLMQTSLAVRETVMKLLDVAVYICVYFGSMIVLMATLDARLAVPMLFWVAGYVAILSYFLPKLRSISSRQADARAEMTGRIVDTYTNIHTVKLFSHAGREENYARDGMDQFLKTVHPQMRLATALNISVWTLNAILIFSLASLGILLWIQGAISTGAIAAALAMVLRINGMSQWIMWEISALFENIGTAQDGANTLSKTLSVTDAAGAEPLSVARGEIDFHKVSFDYGKEKNVIDNFSLHIKPGEKIGLVGRSGAGKSTLVNLLLRFYDIENGKLTIDQQNICEVTQQSLRQHIGMVTQDTSLLHRSIRDNLLYGRPKATEQEMLAAAQKAQAHEFILGLQDSEGRTGYDAHVGERGVKLSGGQRQRIAIARVLLKDAPILILDEATSALDSEVESIIQSNLSHLMADKTVIAIAHRLSTIAALDRLIVLEQGKIAEQGTHSELINKGGIYAQLWQHQSGGFLGES